MADEDIEEVVITEEQDNQVVTQEEEEATVVDYGQSYVSTESATIAKQEADKAKLWAEESERQANLSTASADTSAEARDEAVSAKDIAVESANIAEYYGKNIKFGMVRQEFTTNSWRNISTVYYIDYDYDVAIAVYKQTNYISPTYELMTNIDIIKLNTGQIRIISLNRFDGFVLLVNSAEKETDKNYVFEQAETSDTWTITHNLNKRPSITVVDTADNIIYPAVQYIDNNSCIITFDNATKGKAYLN